MGVTSLKGNLGSVMKTKAIFIGINKHVDSNINELNGATRDATALWALFTDNIDNLLTRLLLDQTATFSAVKDTIFGTLNSGEKDDVVIISFAGHGSPDGSLILHDTLKSNLPGTVFRVSVRQIDGGKNSILGSCEWIIPILEAEALLVIEQSQLALFRKIDMAIPANDQWKPVFGRYIKHIGEKVRGLGGDPDIIEPSLQGHIPDKGGVTADGNGWWQCCRLNFVFYLFLTLLVVAIGWLLLPSPQGYIVLVLAAFAIFILIIKVLRCDCKDQQRTPTRRRGTYRDK